MASPSNPALKSTSPRRRALRAPLVATTSLALVACGVTSPILPPSAPHTPAEARPPQPAPDAVWAQVEPEKPEEHWSLLGSDNKVLCELPCAHWISPTTGEYLQYDLPGTNRSLQVSFPNELGPSGSTVVAVARPGRPSRRASTSLIFGGVIIALAGVISFAFLDQQGQSDVGDIISLVVTAASVPVIGAGIYLRFKSHPPDVAVHAASAAPSSTFALGPGFIEAGSTSPAGFHVVLTPLGAAGTF